MDVSVITVVYNDVLNIERTIYSVLQQTYKDFEYIVIDGNSTDGTVESIRKHTHKIQNFVSEPDTGIYDAMNKGSQFASGRWLIFMNSGDMFFDDKTLEKSIPYLRNTKSGIVYGNHKVRFSPPRGCLRKEAGDPEKLIFGSQFCHQAVFIDRLLQLAFPYDPKKRLAADFDFFIKCKAMKVMFMKLPLFIASISSEGVSDNNQVSVIREWLISVKENMPNVVTNLLILSFYWRIAKAWLMRWLKLFYYNLRQ